MVLKFSSILLVSGRKVYHFIKSYKIKVSVEHFCHFCLKLLTKPTHSRKCSDFSDSAFLHGNCSLRQLPRSFSEKGFLRGAIRATGRIWVLAQSRKVSQMQKKVEVNICEAVCK